MTEKKSFRLGSIALLPREADDDIAWAEASFKEGRTTQISIYAEFAKRLIDKGIEPPSSKAFHRWTMLLREKNALPASGTDGLFILRDETRRLLAAGLRALADDLDRGDPDQATDEIRRVIRSFLGLPQ